MKECKLCIVGMGAAGLLTLFSLSFSKLPPEEIVLIDPYHDGGDLQRKYATVNSNTIWNQMLEVLSTKGIPIESLPPVWRDLDPAKPALLKHSIQLLRYVTQSYRNRCVTLYSSVSRIQEENGTLRIFVEGNECIQTKLCILTTGCVPKLLGFPIPTIPLEVALNRTLLSSYVEPNQSVCVFGTAHSGTLILQNLHELKVNTHAFYKGTKPFSFARDGEYDGIKQESETIADAIVAGTYASTHLHPFTDTAEIIRWTRKADWIIYATGFQKTSLTTSLTYDGTTGRINELPNTWGFGIAFPNLASDGIHWDVSIPSFFSHIEAQLPKIVESFYA
jgi:hypothetical protein